MLTWVGNPITLGYSKKLEQLLWAFCKFYLILGIIRFQSDCFKVEELGDYWYFYLGIIFRLLQGWYQILLESRDFWKEVWILRPVIILIFHQVQVFNIPYILFASISLYELCILYKAQQFIPFDLRYFFLPVKLWHFKMLINLKLKKLLAYRFLQ